MPLNDITRDKNQIM